MTTASSPTTDEMGRRQRALSAVGYFRGGGKAPLGQELQAFYTEAIFISNQNVDVVLTTFRAFQARDDETLFAHYAPDIEWDLRDYSVWTEQPLFRGHDGIRQFFRIWLEDFTDYETEALDPLDAGDRVVVTVVDRAEGRRSGAVIERVHDQIWTFRDRMVVRVQILDSRAAALKAVAMAE